MVTLEDGLCLHSAHSDFQPRWRDYYRKGGFCQSRAGAVGRRPAGGDLRSSLFLLAAVFPFLPLLCPCAWTVDRKAPLHLHSPEVQCFPWVATPPLGCPPCYSEPWGFSPFSQEGRISAAVLGLQRVQARYQELTAPPTCALLTRGHGSSSSWEGQDGWKEAETRGHRDAPGRETRWEQLQAQLMEKRQDSGSRTE